MKAPRWHALWIGEGFNPRVHAIARNASGAYAIRETDTHIVRYVGESSRGVLWKTLIRHFQAPDSFRGVRERGIFTGDPRRYEVAVHVTSRGPRPKPPAEGCEKTANGCKETKRLRSLKRRGVRHTTKLDAQAKAAQARWIATLRPTVNVDDGGGPELAAQLHDEPEDDYFGQFAENPAPLGPNVAAERRAENRTPDIFTGRTRLEDGGKARRDWKGDAERLARELAACRRAAGGADMPSPATLAADVARAKPEGYGTTDEKGQARMFKRNPGGIMELSANDLIVDVGPAFSVARGSREKFQNAIVRGYYRRTAKAALVRWDGAGYESEDEKQISAWLVKALQALHAERNAPLRGGPPFFLPGSTASSADDAIFWLRLVAVLPPVPFVVAVRPWVGESDRHGTDGFFGAIMRYTPRQPPQVVALAYDEGIARLVALLAELGEYAILWKELGRSRTAAEARARGAAYDGDPDTRARWQRLAEWLHLAGVDVPKPAKRGARELKPPPPAQVGRLPQFAVGDRIVGPFVGVATVESARRGEGARGAPEYSARTDRGVLHALNEDQPLKLAPKVEGHGEVETKGRGAGRQLRLLNPPPDTMPVGNLTTMGKLTVLVPKSGAAFLWSLREAPLLGYDSSGRLFIVYPGRIVRRSTPAELREYGRSHWGADGGRSKLAGKITVGPYVVFSFAKSITYTTKKGADSALVDYVHPFGEGAPAKGFIAPQIVEHECAGGCATRCAARGSIALLGGSYRVTSRGIVG